ncbi:HNH endonuclease [soil metagenome]
MAIENSRTLDAQVRAAAFQFLEERSRHHDGSISHNILKAGFTFRGAQVNLIGPKGIFKPRILSDYPLSILTVAPKPGKPRPYDDGFQADGSVIYRYRGVDPQHYDNQALRRAMRDHVPLIYFHGTVPGWYIAQWPVYVINDDPASLSFHIDVDGTYRGFGRAPGVADEDLQRRYAMRSTRQRLHQCAFRDRVLRAYSEHCAVCRLRHAELLDAAHIIPDIDPLGEPRVSNGISLCKLHHAAFDQQLFGIRPDFSIEVRESVLNERDGPILRHGLQAIHKSQIIVPRAIGLRPDPAALEARFMQFNETRTA